MGSCLLVWESTKRESSNTIHYDVIESCDASQNNKFGRQDLIM